MLCDTKVPCCTDITMLRKFDRPQDYDGFKLTASEFLCISKSIFEVSVILIIGRETSFLCEHTWTSSNKPLAGDFPLNWAGKEIFSISLNFLEPSRLRRVFVTLFYMTKILFLLQRKRTIEILSIDFYFGVQQLFYHFMRR